MRPFTLPTSPTSADCDAYVYLCERPSLWCAWCAVLEKHPSICASNAAILVRVSGTPIDAEHARSIARIYRATHGRKAA
jgi:hypothetical protein